AQMASDRQAIGSCSNHNKWTTCTVGVHDSNSASLRSSPAGGCIWPLSIETDETDTEEIDTDASPLTAITPSNLAETTPGRYCRHLGSGSVPAAHEIRAAGRLAPAMWENGYPPPRRGLMSTTK